MSHVPATTDEVLALLRSRGARVTTPRRAVIEALLDGGDHHVTAEDIAARVQRLHPEVHRSTVYRTLERLEEIGVVTHVHLGHGPSTYHVTHRPHQHAVCRACGAVVELPVDALDAVARRLRADHGFRLAHQHFALSGLCQNCAGAD